MKAVWIACLFASQALGQMLPVHVEESHAGAFYHLVETLPLREAHTLVLIDAHCDANGIANSDEIRKAIRRGPTVKQRSEMLAEWRKMGKIQCYNWIEPLMPAPIAEVIWIPAARLSEEERVALETDAREYLDAHEEALPREAGALGARYRVMSMEAFASKAKNWPEAKPVVASVDLDYFAKSADAELEAQVDEMMEMLLRMRALRGLSFAISSPYLKSEAQAERLITLALDAAWRIPNAEVHFDPFAKTGPDRSLMARMLERQGKQLPAFDVAKAGPELRSVLLQNWRDARAEVLLAEWAGAAFQHRLEVPGSLKATNGAWEMEFSAKERLEVVPKPVGARVRWWAVRAADKSYRIGDANLGFAVNAPRWMWRRRELLAEGPVLSRLNLEQLTRGGDCGTYEVYAEIIRDGESTRTPVEIVRLSKPGTMGVRAEWSREFGLPYVFDSRLLMRGTQAGAEACHGADCANFITAGLRAEGWLLPWGSPNDVKPFLTRCDFQARPLLLHFGSHLAALWEDRPPVGQLDDADLCVHQLEGLPEILPYGKLRQKRAEPMLMTVREPEEVIRIAICGDVMLGRGVAEHADPLKELAPVLKRADLALGNLECVIGTAQPRDWLQLIAPLKAAKLLREAGVDGVSVENNHAMDLGPEGKVATEKALQEEHITPIGTTVRFFEVKGRRIAVIALDDSREDAVVPEMKFEADYVIALPHWGREHRTVPTERQREVAAKLMESGVHLIAGSGPHALQPLEHGHAGSVAFSLGNAVFDGPGPDAEWERGAVLAVTLDAKTCRAVRMRMIEVKAVTRE
ncbi:CapA family protein [Prosthecobacter sp.]|uniref:CapA family protein n=1 Tax=Prosthecobacter sp. TaxID=1965333 RepID=UPI0037838F47